MRDSAVGCLVTLTLSLLAAPLTAEAQAPAKVWRIGFLSAGWFALHTRNREACVQGLHELGWMEGHNLALEYRYTEGSDERLPALAAELVRLQVDVIFAPSAPAPQAATQATTTTPIVMDTLGDPVQAGLVTGLAPPGGNITGTAGFAPELGGKQLERLKMAVPGLTAVAALANPANPHTLHALSEIVRAAHAFAVQLRGVDVREASALDAAFAVMTHERTDALIVRPDPMVLGQRQRIVAWAAQRRLPVMDCTREFVEVGGLMTDGPALASRFRHAATYVDKLLKGATPADLPVEQPIQFELVINLKSAQAMGLTLPPTFLFQATEVIQSPGVGARHRMVERRAGRTTSVPRRGLGAYQPNPGVQATASSVRGAPAFSRA
jgi:putative ABC transport system substrate-binding protein